MSDILWWFDGIDQSTNAAEWWAVSAEQIEAVQEKAKKAAQVWATKQQQSKRDNQNAKLLSLLLKYIDDDRLLEHISKQLVELRIPPHLVVVQFLPLLKAHTSIEALQPLYKHVRAEQERCLCRTTQEIRNWYTVLWKMYNELQDLPSAYKTSLLTARFASCNLSEEQQQS
jgi:hypothetical protein